MASTGASGKYSIQHLPVMDPPLPDSGGRMVNASGEMAQIIGNEPIRHVVYIDFQPDGKPRGNHYHVERQMHGVYIIKGSVTVTLVDIDDKSHETVTLQAGDFIRIGSRCAHVFVAQEYTQALELNDTAWNPADTIPYTVIKPAEEKK